MLDFDLQAWLARKVVDANYAAKGQRVSDQNEEEIFKMANQILRQRMEFENRAKERNEYLPKMSGPLPEGDTAAANCPMCLGRGKQVVMIEGRREVQPCRCVKRKNIITIARG